MYDRELRLYLLHMPSLFSSMERVAAPVGPLQVLGRTLATTCERSSDSSSYRRSLIRLF
jgi:hypothetical protein